MTTGTGVALGLGGLVVTMAAAGGVFLLTRKPSMPAPSPVVHPAVSVQTAAAAGGSPEWLTTGLAAANGLAGLAKGLGLLS